MEQGDLVSLGAVTLVGVGASAAWNSTAVAEQLPADAGDELWSLTVESDVGWYLDISQDCDIVRDPAIEPALVVCPLRFVTTAAWQALRSGRTSPREFPFPDGRGLPAREGFKPVADLRFVTSVDKTALQHPSVPVQPAALRAAAGHVRKVRRCPGMPASPIRMSLNATYCPRQRS